MSTTDTNRADPTLGMEAEAATPFVDSPRPEDTAQLQNLRRTGAILTFLWILHLGAQAWQLPMKVFLKNQLHLTALGVASTIAVAMLLWNVKFVFGWAIDSFPIRNRRRLPYLLIGSAIAIAGYAGLLLLPKTVEIITVTLSLGQVGLVMCSSTLGGLMVETGNAAGNLAKLTSIRGTAWTGMALLTGPLTGWLAGKWIGLTCGSVISCCVITALLTLQIKEPPVAKPALSPLRLLIDPIVALFGHRNYLFAIAACILLNIMPGFTTPLLFMQTNVLKFSPQTIGNFGVIAGICGVVSGLGCVALSKRWPLKRLIVVSTVANAVLTLAYLQYNSLPHAMIIEGINGFITPPSTIVIFLIAGYSIPKGYEAVGYSIMMGLANGFTSISDVLGSFLSSILHWNFQQLVWINSGTTLAILLLVPFMPKIMLNRKDSD